MLIRGWPALVVLVLAAVGVLVAAARLGMAVPALLGPLVLIGALVALLVALGLALALPLAQQADHILKRLDWRRWHAWNVYLRERTNHQRTKAQLMQADTELRLAVRAMDERERTIAERDAALDLAYAEIRRLRDVLDKASSNMP